MKIPRYALVLTALALAPLALAAAEKYTLKIDKPAQVGDRAKLTVKDNKESTVTVRDGGGIVLQEKTDVEETNEAYEETILAKAEGKRASKLARKYESITATKDGKKLDVDLAGKTIIIERDGKDYQFHFADGGEVTGDALEYLKDAFKNKDEEERELDKAMLPKGPIAVGEKWTCNMQEVANAIGKNAEGGIDIAKSNATGKLLRVYSKGGAKFGVIESTATFVLTRIGPASANIKADADSTMTLKMTVDTCIDGSRTEWTMTGGMEIKASGAFSRGGQDFTMKITGKGKSTRTESPLK